VSRLSSYGRFRATWEDPGEALAYRENRFSRSRRWRWTDRRERVIVSRFLASMGRPALGLDLPCGAGRLSVCFLETGHGWLGVDASLAMARLARSSASGPALVADATALPFRDRTFPFLVSVRLLHRIQEPGSRMLILRELARVSKGPILLTYYTRWNLRGIQRWLRGKHPGLSLGEIRAEIQEAGLSIRQAMALRRLTQQQWFFVVQEAK